jgi:outer membrane receptor protein involved in Fe transport
MTLAFQGYWADWDAPSYLDRALVQSGDVDEKAAVNPTDGGKQNNQLGYLRYRHGARSRDPFAATAYFVHRDWKRWRSDFLLSPTQTQVQQVDERIGYGLRVEKNVGRTLFGRPSLLLVGAAVQRDDAATRQDRTVERRSIGQTDDVDELLTSLGVYAQEQLQAADWLKLMAGLRYSRVDYDIHDNLRAPGTFVESYDTDVFSPKAGLAVSLGSRVGLYANFATGMRSPTPRTEVRNSIGSIERVQIAETQSYEIGLTARPTTRFELLAAAWRANNSNEIRGIPPGGVQFESLGRSRREGVEAELNFYPVPRTRIYAGVSFVDAVLTTAANPLANHLPDIPEYVHKVGFETHVQRTGGWPGTLSVAADFAIYGPKDLNTLGTIRAERYERITASIAYSPRDRYRLWLGGFAYPGSRIGESAFLFNQRVGVRPNPRLSLEAGLTYTF